MACQEGSLAAPQESRGCAVPGVKIFLGYYDAVKTYNRFLGYGLSYVETGICSAVDNVSKSTWPVFSDVPGSTFVHYTVERLEEAKTSYHTLRKVPRKFVKKTKRRTMARVKKGAASVLDTRVGQMFMSGLDTAVTISEKTLGQLQPAGRKTPKAEDEQTHGLKSPKKPEEKTDRQESENNGQTDQETKTVSSKEQQTEISGADILRQNMKAFLEDGWISRIRHFLLEVVLLPLELTVEILKSVQAFTFRVSRRITPNIRRSARKTKPIPITPEKREEIDARRKISPKKRIQSSLLGNLKRVTCKVFGLERGAPQQRDIRDFIKCSKHKGLNRDPVVGAEDAEKKRKHDDIDSQGSLSSEEDLMYMDLDNYESEDDPDYEPTDSTCSDVSIESGDGLSEGYLEVEQVDVKLIQIKEQEKEVKPEVQEVKSTEEQTKAKEVDKKPKEKPKEKPANKENQKPKVNVVNGVNGSVVDKSKSGPADGQKPQTVAKDILLQQPSEDKNKNVCSKQMMNTKIAKPYQPPPLPLPPK